MTWLKHLILDVSLLRLRDGVYLVTEKPSSRSSVLFLIPSNLPAARCDSHQNLFLSLVTFLLYYSLDVRAKETILLSNVGSLLLMWALRHSPHSTGNRHKCEGRLQWQYNQRTEGLIPLRSVVMTIHSFVIYSTKVS